MAAKDKMELTIGIAIGSSIVSPSSLSSRVCEPGSVLTAIVMNSKYRHLSSLFWCLLAGCTCSVSFDLWAESFLTNQPSLVVRTKI